MCDIKSPHARTGVPCRARSRVVRAVGALVVQRENLGTSQNHAYLVVKKTIVYSHTYNASQRFRYPAPLASVSLHLYNVSVC